MKWIRYPSSCRPRTKSSIKWYEQDSWQSTIYNFGDMDQDKMNETKIPELDGKSIGGAISSLKESWKGYKISRERGDVGRIRYYANIINRVQEALGITITEFQF